MTKREADREARARWGDRGRTRRQTEYRFGGYQVGRIAGFGWTRVFEEIGRGNSWESAFADADEALRQHGGIGAAILARYRRGRGSTKPGGDQ